MRSRWRRSPPASPGSPTLPPALEAIALAHDCGHGPAGHASEEAFSPFLPDTGYDHAVYGADVTLTPLNLCLETLDGVRNHSWRRPAPSTPEGEVVAWADRIAYVCHDFEDAVRAGILSPPICPPRCATSPATRRSQQIGTFVGAVLEAIDRTGQVGHDRTGGVRAGQVPSLQLRSHLPPAAARAQADEGDPPARRAGRALRRRAGSHPEVARRRGRGAARGIARGGRARGAATSAA